MDQRHFAVGQGAYDRLAPRGFSIRLDRLLIIACQSIRVTDADLVAEYGSSYMTSWL